MTRRRYISETTRKENWRQEEISTLAEGVSDHLVVIKGKISSFVTSEKKANALEEVLERYIMFLRKLYNVILKIKHNKSYACINIKNVILHEKFLIYIYISIPSPDFIFFLMGGDVPKFLN